MAKPQPLEDRIKDIRAEIDALIDVHAKEVAKQCPNVPLAVIRQTIVGHNVGCQCAAYEALTGGNRLIP